MNTQKQVELYTDGACSGNPGPGGWGALLRYGDTEKTLNGGEFDTTNNRMELLATIMGLRALNQGCSVKVITDSIYVKNGITQWLPNWKKNGWRTSNRKPVKNQDLWEALEKEVLNHEVEWEWVKGHSGHPENELVDQLAKDAIADMLAKGQG